MILRVILGWLSWIFGFIKKKIILWNYWTFHRLIIFVIKMTNIQLTAKVARDCRFIAFVEVWRRFLRTIALRTTIDQSVIYNYHIFLMGEEILTFVYDYCQFGMFWWRILLNLILSQCLHFAYVWIYFIHVKIYFLLGL